jgi:predicted DNA-binding transcriptional regulator AlpA
MADRVVRLADRRREAAQDPPPFADRRISMREIVEMDGRHRATIYREIQAGTFPAGELRGNRRSWWLSEVLQALNHPSLRPPAPPG